MGHWGAAVAQGRRVPRWPESHMPALPQEVFKAKLELCSIVYDFTDPDSDKE